MAKKAKNNNLIIGICAAAVLIIVIIVAIVLATRGGNGFGGLNDSYFVSDGTKYVLTLDAEEIATESEEYSPIKTHMVYFYSGDEITDMKIYYEFANEETAKSALNYYKESLGSGEYKDISTNGKYVVITANESDYEGITASDVQQQIEFMEMLKNMDYSEDEEDIEVIDATDEEDEILEEE